MMVFNVLLLLLPLLSSAQIPPADNDLHVYALPVGQGDATVIQCPTQLGGSLFVVDMGSTRNRGFMTKDNIRTWLNGQRVEGIFLTHPDRDHFNLMNAIGANIPDRLPIFHTCEASEYDGVSMDMAGWNANLVRIQKCVADDNDCRSGLPSCGNLQICQDQALIRVLAAELNDCDRGGKNTDSMALKLEYLGKSVLLLGDLEDKNGNSNPTAGSPYDILLRCAHVRSNIMRLAHHGAYGKANKKVLLSRVNPEFAFSSSGFLYFHPRCDIYRLLSGISPGVPNPNLVSDARFNHVYTCGDTERNPNAYISGVIPQTIFVTSVCADNILGNYIISFRIITDNGQVGAQQDLFNSHTQATFPPGSTFPC